MNSFKLENIIQMTLDGSVSQQDFALLEAELIANPASLHTYRQYARLSSSLDTLHEAQLLIGHSSVVPVDKVITFNKKRARIISLATAAVAVIALSIGLHFKQAPSVINDETYAHFQISPGTRYEFSHPSPSIEPGENQLTAGSHLNITQGCVQISLPTGVRAIVQAPARLTLDSDDNLILPQGRAWFHVPPSGHGFRVRTNELMITDLGTEFGVISHPDTLDEVHVLAGTVEVQTTAGIAHKAILTAGESRRIYPGGKLKTTPRASFIQILPKAIPYTHWSFDKQEQNPFPASGHHIDLVSATAVVANGRPAITIPGKFGGALRLTGGIGEQLSTNLQGIYGQQARTVACWVRIPKDACANGTDVGGIINWGYWHLSQSPARQQPLWSPSIVYPGVVSISGSGIHRGNTLLADDQWHHLAFVLDPAIKDKDKPNITIYVDGKAEKLFYHSDHSPATSEIPPPLAYDVTLGSELNAPQIQPDTFNGDIDELFLIQGAIDIRAVNHLMNANQLDVSKLIKTTKKTVLSTASLLTPVQGENITIGNHSFEENFKQTGGITCPCQNKFPQPQNGVWWCDFNGLEINNEGFHIVPVTGNTGDNGSKALRHGHPYQNFSLHQTLMAKFQENQDYILNVDVALNKIEGHSQSFKLKIHTKNGKPVGKETKHTATSKDFKTFTIKLSAADVGAAKAAGSKIQIVIQKTKDDAPDCIIIDNIRLTTIKL